MPSVGVTPVDVSNITVIVTYNTGKPTTRTFAMNRKLHSTLIFLTATGVLLLGWLAIAPVASVAPPAAYLGSASSSSVHQPASATQVNATAQPLAAASDLVDNLDQIPASESTVHKTGSSGNSRRLRQSMAMPFFSFAPRG